MRFAMLIAAFGIMTGAPALVPALSPAAHAQAAAALTPTVVLTPAEQALQTQIVTLANAGDTAGLNALIEQQTAFGNAATLAKVAKAVAESGVSLVSSNPTGAAALVNAAMLIASDTSVAAADNTVGSAVGASASLAVVLMGRSAEGDADAAAAVISVATAAKLSSNTSVGESFYANGDTRAKQAYDRVVPPTTTTTPTTPTTQTVQRRQTPPPPPQEPVVPIVPEPNPSQAGSPV
ncbi:hypothetical protein [Kordiimonas sp.]|uniref:hypothetical protein n=1 Tax=Kordiimonas sp. TaxID=1970157 RepID=UPI003B51CCE0